MEDDSFSELDSYSPGTIIWVKLPSFSWWPAEVCFIRKPSVYWHYVIAILVAITDIIKVVAQSTTDGRAKRELEVKTYGDSEE